MRSHLHDEQYVYHLNTTQPTTTDSTVLSECNQMENIFGPTEYIGLFNEFASIWQDKGFDYNEKHYCYVDFVNECINMMKNKGLKCSVSIAGSSPTGNSSYRTVSKNILDNSNCILINAYPHVGNKSNYSLQDTKSAWDNASVQYVLEDIANKYGNDKKVIITETGSPDDFRSYFAPANTTLIANPSISNEGGKAIELYLRGMFESRIKDYDILEGVTHWFRIYNGQEITKKTIKKYIYGGN